MAEAYHPSILDEANSAQDLEMAWEYDWSTSSEASFVQEMLGRPDTSTDANVMTFLDFPGEIRNAIYKHCIDGKFVRAATKDIQYKYNREFVELGGKSDFPNKQNT
ncbi:hypothetical protein EJ08DRAFT_664796 [Tothia fuscella]|uniref:F-box domain-containing protein n=1 Tax=Tothia fuscella TaxID=1048955 RepID=A0A9P4NI37_9PEZI|nr:hypothetical protein EJ08DRAFT_664796 [Tothia fuscella]